MRHPLGHKIFGKPEWEYWNLSTNEPSIAKDAVELVNTIAHPARGTLRTVEYSRDIISKMTLRSVRWIAPLRVDIDRRVIVIPFAHSRVSLPWETSAGKTTVSKLSRAVHFYVPHSHGSTNYYLYGLYCG